MVLARRVGPALFGLVLGSEAWPTLTEPRVLLAFVVMGPSVWGCVLLANDTHDLSGRNSYSPSPPSSRPCSCHRCSGSALPWFWVWDWDWAYGCPPLRLKSRPGADVAVNALAIGVLAPLGGWSLVQPVMDYPLALAALGLLVGSAPYLPTTVIDRTSDQLAGDQTFAVRFGERTAYALGVGPWCAAIVGWLVWCQATDHLDAGAVQLQALVCAPLVPLYAVLVARPSIARLAVVSAGFLVAGLCFITTYAGWPA